MKPSALHDHPRSVGLLVDTSTQWARQTIIGINNYARMVGGWHMFLEPKGANEVLRLPKNWKGDGIIADIRTPEMAEEMKDARVPVVNISHAILKHAFPRVSPDTDAACRMAVEYFLTKGFRHFGYIDLQGNSFDVHNFETFSSIIKERGCQCHEYKVGSHGWGVTNWDLSIEKLGKWLKALEKPVAIFSWGVGREVIHACRTHDIRVPEEVALLLLGYDEIFCEVSHVPMSGILHSCHEIGFEAAKMLHTLIRGEKVAQKEKWIEPIGIQARQSTDTIAVKDKILVTAIHFIRANANAVISVDDVARQAGVSRRDLERRFARTLDCTPAEHIRNTHIERAKLLLKETHLAIPEVADSSGFGSPEYMAFIFQSKLGLSPLKYRKKVQATT